MGRHRLISPYHFLGFTIAFVLMVAAASYAPAQVTRTRPAEPSAVDSRDEIGPLRFRRVFVPADRPETWPRQESEKYLAMPAEEFERRIAQLQGKSVSASNPLAARLVRAVYRAELTDDLRLNGSGSWTFENPQSKPEVVTLPECRVPIDHLQWDDKRSRTIAGNDSQGRFGVLVERSGLLRFSWSVRASEDRSGVVIFPLPIPHGTATVLHLTLPSKFTPTVKTGIVTASNAPRSGVQSWSIEFGGSSPTELRLINHLDQHSNRTPSGSLPLAHESSKYEVSRRGLDLTLDVHLDGFRKDKPQLELLLDKPLIPVSVTVGDHKLTFGSPVDVDEQSTRVSLDLSQLPSELIAPSMHFQVRATAPWNTEQLERLPLITVANCRWQSATATVSVSAPLILEDLILEGCRQIPLKQSVEQSGESTLSLQFYHDRPQVELQASIPKNQLAVTSAASMFLRPNRVTETIHARLSSASGDIFIVDGTVAPDWVIDSVDSLPSGTIADWTFQPGRRNRPGSLQIQLRDPIRPATEKLVLITGHRQRPLGAKNPAGRLLMLAFPQAKTNEQWIQIRTSDTHELLLLGENAPQTFDPARHDPPEASLFDTPGAGLTFRLDELSREIEVLLTPKAPTFQAESRGDAVVFDGTLSENYEFAIEPEGREISQLTIHFSQPRDTPLIWKLFDTAPGEVTARQLSEQEQGARGIREGETWEVSLPLSQSQSFRLRAERMIPFRGETPVALASILDAQTQQGTISIHASAPVHPEVRCVRLKVIPTRATDAGNRTSEIAAFRYDPEIDTLLSSDPPLVLVPRAESTPTVESWVWHAVLRSHLSSTESDHSFRCKVENTGRDHVNFTLPKGAELRSVLVNGQSVLGPAQSGSAVCKVPFPPSRRFVEIELQWTSETSLPASAASFASPWPQCDAPILSQQWIVSIPPEWALAQSSIEAQPKIHSLPGRLLGPFQRKRNQAVFNPFSVSAWASLIAPEYATRSSRQQAEFLMDRLKLLREDSETAVTWGDLLLQAAADLRASDRNRGIDVLIDDAALINLGISGQSSLSKSRRTTDEGIFGPELGTADSFSELAFVIRPNAILVTTKGAITRLGMDNKLKTLEAADSLLRLENGPLVKRLAVAGQELNDTEIVPVEQWAIAPAGAAGVWNYYGRPLKVEDKDWISYTLDGASATTQIVLVNRLSFALIAWGIFLFVATLRWLLGKRSILFILVSSGAAVCLAILIPDWLAPLASAIWLGLVAGQVVVSWQGHFNTQRSHAAANAPSGIGSRRVLLATATSLVLWLTWSNGLWGAEAERTQIAPGLGPNIPAVLIPIDENLKPVGDTYFLPEAFYQSLVSATADANFSSPKYLIERASYRPETGTLGKALSAGTWLCTYDLEAFAPEAMVRLPLGMDGGSLVPDGIRLDGKVVPIRWNDSHKLLEVVIPEGKHRLEVQLRPHANQGGISFSIPQVCSSLLYLDPDDLASWRVGASPGIDNRPQHEPDNQDILAVQLGPVEHVALQPQSTGDPAQAAKSNVFHVDELYWLRIRPGTVVVDARFKFKVQADSPRQVALRLDPRLRPIQMGTVNNTQFAMDPQDPQTLLVELGPDTADTQTINLSFLVKDATGVGSIQLPWAKVVGATSREIYWGVSIDPTLQSKEIDAISSVEAGGKADTQLKAQLLLDDNVDLLPPQAFHSAWGGGDTNPQIVLHSRNELDWGVSIVPRATQQSVQYRVGVSLGPEIAEVRAAIDMSVADSSSLSYRISIPSHFKIDDVVVMEQNRIREARWSQGRPNTLTVFLTSPLTGESRLLLRGTIPISKTSSFTIPCIHVEQCLDAGFRAVVLRRSMILARVENFAGASAVDTDDWPTEVEDAKRLGIVNDLQRGNLAVVGVFKGENGILPMEFHIEPNRSKLAVHQLTSMNRTSDGWFATVSIQLDVKQGLVDNLRFDLPSNWKGPFTLSPSLPYSIETIPPENRQQLVVRHRPPLAGKSSLQITGPVNPAAGERPSAPHVKLLNSDSEEAYFLLPRQSEGQLLSWDVRGLVATNQLPKDLAEFVPHADKYRSYQLTGGQFRAAFRSAERPADNVRVRLANTAVAWSGSGHYAGVTSFDLEPGGATSVLLELPATCRLIQARIDGTPAQLAQLPDHRWDIFVGMNKLPRRLEAIFEGQIDVRSSFPWRLTAPSLPGIPVDRSLWTVYSPPQAGQAEAPESNLCSPLRYELLRIEDTASLIDSTAAILLEEPPDDVLRWSSPWVKRFVVSKENAERMRILAPQAPFARDVATQIAAVESDQLRLARRLDAVPQWNELISMRPVADDALRIWMSLQNGFNNCVHGVTQGASPTFTVSYANWPGDDLATRLWLALGISVSITVVIAAIIINSPLRRACVRWVTPLRLDAKRLWPPLVIVTFGIVWWLYCMPSVLGVLIVLIGMVLLASPIWRQTVVFLSSQTVPAVPDASHSNHSTLSHSRLQREGEAKLHDSQKSTPRDGI